MDYNFRKGSHYIVEWVDVVYLMGIQAEKAADADIDSDEIMTTYGRFLTETDGSIFLETLPRDNGKARRIPRKCITNVVEVEGEINILSVAVAFIMFAGIVSSLYLNFNPPQVAIDRVIDVIISENIIYLPNGPRN